MKEKSKLSRIFNTPAKKGAGIGLGAAVAVDMLFLGGVFTLTGLAVAGAGTYAGVKVAEKLNEPKKR